MRQSCAFAPQPGHAPVTATIARWLGQGWRDFRRTPLLSMGFSALFLLIGAGVTLALLARGRPLLAFPFLAGFPLLAPLFALGFYRVARVLDEGGRPGPGDLLRGFTRAGAATGAVALLLVFCYFIWITDALLLYALYFGSGREWDAWIGFQDPALVERTTGFLLFAGLTGLVLALGLFVVAVLSLPRLSAQGGSFITAVVGSVRQVFARPVLMLGWGLLLAVAMFVSLLLLPPLFLLTYPLLSYAGYRACQDQQVVGRQEDP